MERHSGILEYVQVDREIHRINTAKEKQEFLWEQGARWHSRIDRLVFLSNSPSALAASGSKLGFFGFPTFSAFFITASNGQTDLFDEDKLFSAFINAFITRERATLFDLLYIPLFPITPLLFGARGK